MPVEFSRCVMLSAAVFCAAAMPAAAQEAAPLALDIPAGRLADALTLFGQQSGEQVVFSPDAVEGRRSEGLKGRYTVRQGLEHLLAGSGLLSRALGHRTIAIVVPPPERRAKAPPVPLPVQAKAPMILAPGVEQVQVTGTSIHGMGDIAPVGSSLILVPVVQIRDSGAQTLQQALADVPSLTGFGAVGQGAPNSSYYAPTIHQLGASASNSTLVLIDGHRVPEGGTNHPTVDPNIVPLPMIDHIEILADGASATYGSDAVAGVINIITRKSFDGVEATLQGSTLSGASDAAATVLAGQGWADGGVILAYGYSFAGQLDDISRPYTNPDHTAQGGTNLNIYNCSPATLQPGGGGAIYSVDGTALAQASCSGWAEGALVPQEIRSNVMLRLDQQLGDALSVTVDFNYGNRRDRQIASRGTLTARAYGTGPQANPFYLAPDGYAGGARSETVRWSADDLLGPGAMARNGADTWYAHMDAEYRLSARSTLSLMLLEGHDTSFSRTLGVINGSVANLALNGTPNSAGNLVLANGITGLPLTADTALDVWQPAATNRTSAAVRAALLDNANDNVQGDGITEVRLSGDGDLMQLPAGPLRFAAGMDYLAKQVSEVLNQSNNTGPASADSVQRYYHFGREVWSLFAESDLPLVAPGWQWPLAQRVDLDIAGRFDGYSDFGSTFNPKIGFNWEVVTGLRFKGNVSTSFVAPSLDVIGNTYGVYAQSGFNTYSGLINVPVSAYPAVTQLPGCAGAVAYCAIGSTQQGIMVTNGNHAMRAQHGRGWSLSAEIKPVLLPDFEAQVSLWNNRFLGAITTPNAGIVVNNAPLNGLLTLYPGGAGDAQVAAATAHIPQTGVLPSTAYFIFDFFNGNYLNLDVQGLDASASYRMDADSAGVFVLGGSMTSFLRFKESFGQNGAVYSALNTVGGNQTFPSVGIQSRNWLEWSLVPMEAALFMNYTSAYHNWSGTTHNPVLTNALGNPVAGGDFVHANVTFDMHLAYDFDDSMLEQLSLDVRNIADARPPFYNIAAGYNSFVSSPLGRVTTVTLRIKPL